MKLYTRSGDDGTTGLFGGGRVPKSDARVAAYGQVDELNAAIGLATAACDADRDVPRQLRAILIDIQSRLFDLGADLATPARAAQADKVRRIAAADVEQLEGWIDLIDGATPPLTSFILPGGCELACRLHLARTICRRAERGVVGLGVPDAASQDSMIFLNRLSDLLFAMARRANADAAVPEQPWQKREA